MSYEQNLRRNLKLVSTRSGAIKHMAHKESQKVYEEDQDERAKDAMI